MDAEYIARACHEANRVLQAASGEEPSPHWELAPAWQRESAREGVAAALARRLTPRQQHDAWCESRYADGWTHGPVKDAVARTHPGLVPWDQLPAGQRRKDVLFAAIVEALRPDDEQAS
jgi:hypothetical protein